jgi:hypothetical protein
VVEIADRLRDIDPLDFGCEDLRFAVLDQLRIGAGHLKDDIRQLLDRVVGVAADVVGLPRLEVIDDVRQGADRVGQVRRGAFVAAEDGPGVTTEGTVQEAAVYRAVRTVIFARTAELRICISLTHFVIA